MSYRDPCRHCGRDILVARIRGGRWLPFDIETVEATPDAVDAWVPTRSRGFVPVGEIADHHLANHRRYATRHRCAQFMRWLADRRNHVDGFSDALGALVDLWTKPDTEETP
jgi:hypothetical protein